MHKIRFETEETKNTYKIIYRIRKQAFLVSRRLWGRRLIAHVCLTLTIMHVTLQSNLKKIDMLGFG